MEPIRHSYSKTSDFKLCAHKDYLVRVRRWEPERPNVHLATGLAHHRAMTAIWEEGTSGLGRSQDTAIEAGIAAFWQEWEALGMPLGQELLTRAPEMRAKTPMVGEKVVAAYVATRWEWLGRLKLLASEVRFEVLLFTMEDGTEVHYSGIIDKLVQDEYGIHPFEHKTSSLFASKGGFRNDLIKSFAPNAQVEGYHWWVKQQHGADTGSVYIDLSLYHKEHRAFLVVPIEPAPEVTDAWVARQIAWSKRMIEAHRSYEAGLHPNMAFLRNEEECVGKYGPCKFYDLCRYNPDLELVQDFPGGFVARRPWAADAV